MTPQLKQSLVFQRFCLQTMILAFPFYHPRRIAKHLVWNAKQRRCLAVAVSLLAIIAWAYPVKEVGRALVLQHVKQTYVNLAQIVVKCAKTPARIVSQRASIHASRVRLGARDIFKAPTSTRGLGIHRMGRRMMILLCWRMKLLLEMGLHTTFHI